MIRAGGRLAVVLLLAACAAGPPQVPETGGGPSPAPGAALPAGDPATGATTTRLPSARPSLAVVPPPAAQADAFAVAFLDTLQARSFVGRREYCGYFLMTGGAIGATPPIPGTLASCSQPPPPPNAFASYHTHGAFDAAYDNEVPSPEDMLGDFAFGIDGYISTPGGRVWRVEVDERAALQVCGLGCVAVDPGFVPRNEAAIPPRLVVRDVLARY